MNSEQSNTERIARVFPRRTNATPTDALAFVKVPPPIDLPDIDEVHVSVAFTYDLPTAEQLAEQWRSVGVSVKLGGPAFDEPGGEFVPGRYLKQGYVITSRGCNNRCWFCSVPNREGYAVKELIVTAGFNVLDDNLLACSEQHIRKLFAMLKKQKERPIFTGGLEAKLLKPWHIELLREVRVRRMYFAYDTGDDLEPLIAAGKLLLEYGITRKSRKASCYVLIGYEGDTFEQAETRLRQAWTAGFLPYAMLYRDGGGETDAEWRRFQRQWVRPMIIVSNMAKEGCAL
jgi:hypothetical protein